MDKTDLFERMPVPIAVRKQVVPAVISQMVTLIYNLSDTFFVGMVNDPAQTAALSVASSFFLMQTAISNLFGVGGASAFAQALGKKKERDASRISSISFWFGLLLSILFSACVFLFRHPLLTLCGATGDTYELARAYVMWTVVFGGAGTVLNMLLANLVRAEGNARMASIGVSTGGILNVILDPLFVLPGFLGMGVIGAGIATAISNLIATFIFLAYIIRKRKETLLSLKLSHLAHARRLAGSVMSKGLPSAVQYALTVVAVAAMTKFVSAYDTAAVAGYGIAKKIDQLPLYFTIGVSNGILPLLAYNYASGDRERQKQVFRYGRIIGLAFSVLCLILYELSAPALVSLFISDGNTIRYAAAFLRLLVLAMPLVALNYPMVINFQAMGKVKESLICSLIRKGMIDIPLLFVLDRIVPLYGLMVVPFIVDLIALAVSSRFYHRIFHSE